MFCKKCGNRISETDATCPTCGAVIDRGEKFIAHLSAHGTQPMPEDAKKMEQELSIPASLGETVPEAQTQKKDPVQPEVLFPAPMPNLFRPDAAIKEQDTAKAADEKDALPAVQPESQELQPEPEAQDAESEDDAAVPQVTDKTPEPSFSVEEDDVPAQPKAPTAVVHSAPPRVDRKERRSRSLLLVLVCVCLAAMAALTVFEKKTAFFSKEQTLNKTIPLSSFTDAEKESFESFLSPLSAFFGQTVTFGELGMDDWLPLVSPGEDGGLYAGLFSTKKKVTEPADPNGRFPDGYYRVKTSEIAKIAAWLGVPFLESANTKDYYFDRGIGYFNANGVAKQLPRKVTDAQAKRTESGEYYVTCTCDDGSMVYCLASYDKTNAENPWKLDVISAEALFADDGTELERQTEELPFELRSEIIPAKTKAGALYATYAVIYPLFSVEENAAVQQINANYAGDANYGGILASYREKAASAEKSYAKYRKRGFDPALLPGYIYEVCSVSYHQNGWISLLTETTTYQPEPFAKEKLTAEEAGEIWTNQPTPERTYSGYTVNTQTGETLRKEDLFGENAEQILDLLCETYLGDAVNSLSETERTALEQQIYASPMVLTKDGVAFCYQDQDGYLKEIVLPYTAVPDGTRFTGAPTNE